MKNPFKPKSSAELIESKADQILHDLLICNFNNEEISTVINIIRGKGKATLESRRLELEKELLLTTNAIHSL
jgi:hypothetical protein